MNRRASYSMTMKRQIVLFVDIYIYMYYNMKFNDGIVIYKTLVYNSISACSSDYSDFDSVVHDDVCFGLQTSN